MLTSMELGLASDVLSLRVDPARGGRIVSLAHRPSGRELLWRQPPLPDWPRYGVPEAEADVQGWDECCPAIGPGPFPPGPWGSVQNPAQGEVYALPWRVAHADTERIVMAVHGIRFPYALECELSVAGPTTLRLRYTIANHGALPFPFIWSAHPLLTAPAGGRIVLPAGVEGAIIDSSEGARLGSPYDRIAWPLARTARGEVADLARVLPGAGHGDKLYFPDLPAGECALVRSDGLTIRFTWDTQQIPHLGLWIDTRDGQARVALEPCLGYPDLINEAARWGRHAVLPPDGEQRWEMAVTVEPD